MFLSYELIFKILLLIYMQPYWSKQERFWLASTTAVGAFPI